MPPNSLSHSLPLPEAGPAASGRHFFLPGSGRFHCLHDRWDSYPGGSGHRSDRQVIDEDGVQETTGVLLSVLNTDGDGPRKTARSEGVVGPAGHVGGGVDEGRRDVREVSSVGGVGKLEVVPLRIRRAVSLQVKVVRGPGGNVVELPDVGETVFA